MLIVTDVPSNQMQRCSLNGKVVFEEASAFSYFFGKEFASTLVRQWQIHDAVNSLEKSSPVRWWRSDKLMVLRM